MARLLCTGDSHIGAGRDLAPDRLDEQERVWRDTLDLARAENVDAVLHGGDLWEHRKPDPACYLAAERPLVEHQALGGCPVLMISGNHDRSGVDDDLALKVLAQAGLIKLSTGPDIFHATPEIEVSVCTLPWTPVARLVASQDGGDRDAVFQQAADLLIQTAADLRAQVDGPAVLLLHWSVSGASLPSGLPIEMAREVILPLDELERLGFDAIVCAHVHKPQPLGTLAPADELLPIFYVGSPIPLNFGEAGTDHGFWLLDVAGGKYPTTTFRPLNSRGFETLQLTGDDHLYEYAEALCMDAFVKVRVDATAEQAREIDVAAVRQAVEEAGAVRAWVEVNTPRQARARVEGLDEGVSPLDALEQYLSAQGVNGTVGATLLARAGGYLERARA